MNKEIVNSFVQYYISMFNDKSKFQEFINMWNNHSTLSYNNYIYIKQDLITFLQQLYTYNIDPNNMTINFMVIGERRANILLSYDLINDNNKKTISQYIQLAQSNDKTYWIHSSLLNMI